MDRTFIMIKPDGVQRHLVGEIIGRFERKGLRLVALKLMQPTLDLVEKHYAVHQGKPFYEELVEFAISGPVVAMVWEGPEAITLARNLMGATMPVNSVPGSIRGDFSYVPPANLIHGSDARETAVGEIALWFQPQELLP